MVGSISRQLTVGTINTNIHKQLEHLSVLAAASAAAQIDCKLLITGKWTFHCIFTRATLHAGAVLATTMWLGSWMLHAGIISIPLNLY